jgi:hypothetical protein
LRAFFNARLLCASRPMAKSRPRRMIEMRTFIESRSRGVMLVVTMVNISIGEGGDMTVVISAGFAMALYCYAAGE